MRRLLAPPVLAAAVAACQAPPAGDAYFPLAAGHAWTYELHSQWENTTSAREIRVLRTLGREAIDGGDAWRRRSDSGVDYWLRADAQGIYRVASKSDLDAEPRPDPAPRFVLKEPIAAGTSWQAATAPYLLMRRAEFPPELRHTHPSVPMNYRIEAVGQSVETRAGRFDDCLRVQGVAALVLFSDPVAGWRPMPLTTTEWYCRGVGLVKLQREEPSLGSSFLTGGSLTMELIAWR